MSHFTRIRCGYHQNDVLSPQKMDAGESLAQVLCLAGVRPVADSIGRVNKLELIPLEELGRPRVDVVVSCSGVFRDLFINQMNLLDRGVGVDAKSFRSLLVLGPSMMMIFFLRIF